VLTAQSFNIQTADVEAAVDWKNGSFIFNNDDIKTAMRKLARWYDVEVSYEGNFNDIYFGGSFPRYANFNESIKILESTNKLKCKIEGRRILIKR
jgi:ferric-dicitrate binding protein FerR (iron transport regulator)